MSNSPRSSAESSFIGDIQAGGEEAFEEMFYEYYPQLCVFAAGYVDCYDRALKFLRAALAPEAT